MKGAAALFAPVLLWSSSLTAQKHIDHIEQVWIGYSNQLRVSHKWGTILELQLRTKEDFFTNFSQVTGRVGINYFATKELKLSGGYGYALNFPADNHSQISQPEHRPWQQVLYTTTMKRARLFQGLRLEERFRRKILDEDELGDGYNFNYRFRYNIAVMLPFSKRSFAANTLSFSANDELYVNAGREIINNYFDQNRIFVGLAYHVSNTDYLQLGYTDVFQQLAGNRFKNFHVARIYYYQNLDLR